MALTKITGEGVGDLDTLTVDGDVTLNDGSPNLRLKDTDTNRFVDLLYGTRVSTIRNTMASGEDMDTVEPSMVFSFQDDGETRTAMTLDHDGNLLAGKTSSDFSTVGAELHKNGTSLFTRTLSGGDSAGVAYFRRNTGNGNILLFYKDGTNVGSIGVENSYIFIGSGNTNLRFHDGVPAILPANSSGASRDNAIDLGTSSARFDDIYATNGTIQTSDENEKQQIASLTTAEITAAKAISALFKTFKWNDKVESKGDDARTHTGVIAQEVQTAMSNAGLDAADYAFWCSNTWTDDDGNSQTRMGVRYPELLAFVGAATEQRLANIESRLTALEAE